MENEQSIGDILNDEQPTPENDTPETPEANTEAGQPAPDSGPARDDKGRFAPKETGVEQPQPAPAETASEAPPAPQPDQLPREVYEPLKAIREENRGLKDELRQMREQFARMQQQPQPQQQPPVDFWDDPHAYMATQFNQFGQTLLQQWEQRQQAQRFDAAEKAARSKYADYDEAFSAFESAVQANPRLAAELAQATDPGEYAYRKGKAALALQSVGSLEEYEAQLRAKWEAEVKAAVPTPKPVLPSTTAADGSVGARNGDGFAGPTPITDILR